MPEDTSPSTAGFNIPIPIDLGSVIDAYKQAIKAISTDLDKLTKKAEAQIRNKQPMESALAAEIGSLQDARNNLRQTLAEKRREAANQRLMEKERQERHNAEMAAKAEQKRRADQVQRDINLGMLDFASSKPPSKGQSAPWDLTPEFDLRPQSLGGPSKYGYGASLAKMGMLQRKAALDAEDKATAEEEKRKKEEKRNSEDKMHSQSRLMHLGMAKIGMSPSVVANTIGHTYSWGSSLKGWGGTLSQAGLPGAGGLATDAGESLIGLARLASKYALPLEVAGQAAKLAYSWTSGAMTSQKQELQLLDERLRANAQLTSKMNSLDTGSAQQALNVFARQNGAYFEGVAKGSVGIAEYITNPFATLQGRQANLVGELQQHEAFRESYRQKYGIGFDMRNDPAAKAQAKLAFTRSIDPWQDYGKNMPNAMWYHARSAYYAITGEAGKFQAEEQARFMREQEVKAAGTIDTWWDKYHSVGQGIGWDDSPKYAVQRVMENEKRRWLRDVEIDRVSRFNAWSMQ